jgi:hypothetical protein
MSAFSQHTLDAIPEMAEEEGPTVIRTQPPAYSSNARADGIRSEGQQSAERRELLDELSRWLENGPVGGVGGRSRTAAREMELRKGAPSPLFDIERQISLPLFKRQPAMDHLLGFGVQTEDVPLSMCVEMDRDSDVISGPRSPWSASNNSDIRTSCSSPASSWHSNRSSPRPSATWTEPSSTLPFHPLSMLTGAASLRALSRAGCEVNGVEEPAIRVLSAHSNTDPYNCKLSSVHSSEGNVTLIEDSHSEISGLKRSIIPTDDSGDVTDIEGE